MDEKQINEALSGWLSENGESRFRLSDGCLEWWNPESRSSTTSYADISPCVIRVLGGEGEWLLWGGLFTQSLDSCALIEALLTPEQQEQYAFALDVAIDTEDGYGSILAKLVYVAATASPAIRAQALYEVLCDG